LLKKRLIFVLIVTKMILFSVNSFLLVAICVTRFHEPRVFFKLIVEY
jgi:hypothetical protein